MALTNAVALVAGASGDIGRAISFELLQAGAEVVMLGRSMQRLVQLHPADGVQDRCRYIAADLTTEGAADRIADQLLPSHRMDVLVLSSGTYERTFDQKAFDRQVAANLVGPYALIQRLLPSLIESKGQIVFINSTQALKATGGIGQYAATKHALKAVADSLRDEVNAKGVRVMSVFLGRTAGERQRTIFATENRPYRPADLIQPGDVAGLVLFLLQLPRTSEVTDIVMRPMQKV